MASRSKIDLLPEPVKKTLNNKLLNNAFSDYQGLSDWLKSEGFEIGKSQVHRYGQNFERKLSAAKTATEMAMHFAENAGDDSAALSNATITLMQTEAFNALVSLKELDDIADEDKPKRLLLIAKISKSMSELTRASIAQKKWESEVKAKAKAELIAEQTDKLNEMAKAGGMGAEQVDFWRREFLGVEQIEKA